MTKWTLDLRYLDPKDAELLLKLFWRMREHTELADPTLPRLVREG